MSGEDTVELDFAMTGSNCMVVLCPECGGEILPSKCMKCGFCGASIRLVGVVDHKDC